MKTKFNLDRKPLDSSYIQSRQDFDKVVKGYKAMKPPIWKNPWFYGPVGLASLAVILTLTFQNNIFASGNNSTLIASAPNNNTLPEDTDCLHPISEESDIAFESFTVDPEKGGEFKTKHGSIIKIGPKSLIAKEKGAVTIRTREFPDLASAFLAGVPMDYEDKSAFESGGMIEIRGVQNGKKITIDPGKPIQVDMALHKTGEDFTFWSLNDKSGEWTDYPCAMTSNDGAAIIPAQIPKSDNLEIRKVQEEIIVCDNSIAEINQTKISKDLVPTKNARKLVVDFDAKSFPELAGYKDVEFEYLLPKVQTSANMSKFDKSIKYASSQTWNDMDVSKKGEDYVVAFRNRRETYSVPVRPVLKGTSLKKLEETMAIAETAKQNKLADLAKERDALKEREKALKLKFEENVDELMAKLNQRTQNNALPQRSDANKSSIDVSMATTELNSGRANFLTSGFGLFNCDRPVPYPKLFKIPVVCVTVAGAAIHAAYAYVFDRKRNVRYTYGNRVGKTLADLSWGSNNSTLILVDENGDLYYKKNINDDPLENFTVSLERINRKDVNLEEIQKIVDENTVAA